MNVGKKMLMVDWNDEEFEDLYDESFVGGVEKIKRDAPRNKEEAVKTNARESAKKNRKFERRPSKFSSE